MAFDFQDLVLLSHGNDKKHFYYDADANSDSLATVNTAGYFNNTDDSQRFVADDLITVKGTDGVTTLEVVSVSSGSVTTRDLNARALHTATTASVMKVGANLLAGTTAGTYVASSSPTKGDFLRCINTGVAANAIGTTGSLMFGSTGATTLTLGAIGSGVDLLAASTTQYLIVGSIHATSSTTNTAAAYALS